MKPTELEFLLDELCVRHGFCLSRDARASIANEPPATIDSFVSEVIRLEGLNASALDKSAVRELHASVAAAFEKARRRGDV